MGWAMERKNNKKTKHKTPKHSYNIDREKKKKQKKQKTGQPDRHRAIFTYCSLFKKKKTDKTT